MLEPPRRAGYTFCVSVAQNLARLMVTMRAGGTGVGEDFFSEVTGPIPFGGLDSTEPLSFKVYEPDRLVLGKRMVDHLRPGRLLLALVRLGRRRHVRHRDARPAVADGRRPTRWTPRA